MKFKIISILLILIAIFSMSAVSASDININNTLTNQEIQTIIDTNLTDGDTLNFVSDNYENVSLTIHKGLNLKSDVKSKINSNQSFIFQFIAGSNNSNVSGFIFNSTNPNAYVLDVKGGVSYLTFKDNEFYGGYTQVNLNPAINVNIINNNFTNSEHEAVFIYRSGCVYTNISYNNFYNHKQDVITARGPHNYIAFNYIDGWKRNGINAYQDYADNETIFNNTFKNGGEFGIYYSFMHGDGAPVSSVFANNLFDHIDTGIKLGQADIYLDNNNFKNLTVAVEVSKNTAIVSNKNNNYSDVGKSIYAAGVGVDPSKTPANITITTNISADSVNINDQVTYTIQIHNNGDLDAKNLILSNLLINGTTSVSTILSSGNYTNGIWTLDSLAGGNDAIIVFIVKGTTAGPYNLSTGVNYQSGTDVAILESIGSPISLTVKKATPTPPTPPTPAKPAKITYSFKDKVQGKKIIRTITIKNTGGKAGTISGTLKIASNLKYSKTVVGKYASYKYNVSKKSLTLKVSNLPKSTSTTIIIYFNKK